MSYCVVRRENAADPRCSTTFQNDYPSVGCQWHALMASDKKYLWPYIRDDSSYYMPGESDLDSGIAQIVFTDEKRSFFHLSNYSQCVHVWRLRGDRAIAVVSVECPTL
ncbi:hypothetical protein TNCV_1798441 [Trichonephila clavipes]|uniref:Uncharacterized protein n=1 Tax=Trichonephila clavipes TaxID=2585209 RepID=A0A8X6SEK1_TRICX|nr:hypothetical protein TNCV_1798441 [Trichonephila clavipes]